MPNSPAEQLEAVFLFQEEQISRELLYPEFEAILDGFMKVQELVHNESLRRRHSDQYKDLLAEYGIQ